MTFNVGDRVVYTGSNRFLRNYGPGTIHEMPNRFREHYSLTKAVVFDSHKYTAPLVSGGFHPIGEVDLTKIFVDIGDLEDDL